MDQRLSFVTVSTVDLDASRDFYVAGLTLSQNVDGEADVDARFAAACAAGGMVVKAPPTRRSVGTTAMSRTRTG